MFGWLSGFQAPIQRDVLVRKRTGFAKFRQNNICPAKCMQFDRLTHTILTKLAN